MQNINMVENDNPTGICTRSVESWFRSILDGIVHFYFRLDRF